MMRMSRYLVVVTAITGIALLFTHQQFLLIKTNYEIGKCEKRLSHLLDRNCKLMYNVSALESPAHLEAKLLATGVHYGVPARWTVVKRSKTNPAHKLATVAERRNVVLDGVMDFLTAKAEARDLE